MKKIISIVLISICLFGVTSCGSSYDDYEKAQYRNGYDQYKSFSRQISTEQLKTLEPEEALNIYMATYPQQKEFLYGYPSRQEAWIDGYEDAMKDKEKKY